MLDSPVQMILHRRIARIADDAAIAERARPPLEASLIPADDEAVRDERRGFLGQRLVRQFAVTTRPLPRVRFGTLRRE